jgi:hypothetical protein
MSTKADAFRLKLMPETIQWNLVRAGLFLAAWELLKGEIVDQVRGFLLMTIGDQQPDPHMQAEYEKTVLARDKSVFLVSLSARERLPPSWSTSPTPRSCRVASSASKAFRSTKRRPRRQGHVKWVCGSILAERADPI